MGPRSRPRSAADSIRHKAESRLAGAARPRERALDESARLVHELEVHQVELEMQNEELRRVQLQLEQSRDRYCELYDHAPVGYLTLDRTGKILEANLTATVLLGVPRSRLVGKRLSTLLTTDDSAVFGRHRRQIFSAGPARRSCDVWVRRPDGRVFPAHLESVVESQSAPPAGQSARCRTILTDVSELRVTQRELQESEIRFRQIADEIEDAFYVRELDGETSYVSPAWERIWCRPSAFLAGKKVAWMETIDLEDQERVSDAWNRLAQGEPISEIYRIRRPDGAIRWVQSRGLAIRGDVGQILRYVGVVRDVTTERKLDEELRQAQKMEALGTLASGVAHNLSNVLQAMMAFVHLAKKRGITNERSVQALDRSIEAGRRGASLIGQLMTFARKQDPAMKLRPLRPDAMLADMLVLLRSFVGDEVVVRLQTRAANSAIMADPVQLEQILLNLASNARDAMPEGGTFEIETEEMILDDAAAGSHDLLPGHYVRMSVRDSGAGMDAATRGRVFEPFFTTKEVGKGTGLGLSTVFALTRSLGGSIEVTSEPGHGTTFTLCFPSLQGTPPPGSAGKS
jgi:PAS domain S-box-containing protein